MSENISNKISREALKYMIGIIGDPAYGVWHNFSTKGSVSINTINFIDAKGDSFAVITQFNGGTEDKVVAPSEVSYNLTHTVQEAEMPELHSALQFIRKDANDLRRLYLLAIGRVRQEYERQYDALADEYEQRKHMDMFKVRKDSVIEM